MWIFDTEETGQPNKCKSCGAPIVWGITTNGARCPLNANFILQERKSFKIEGVEITIIKVSDRPAISLIVRKETNGGKSNAEKESLLGAIAEHGSARRA